MSKDKLAQVFHFDLYGKRESKYDFLNKNSLKSIEWNKLQPIEPNFFLVKKDFDQSGEYEKGFMVNDLFNLNNIGIATGKDAELISLNKESLEKKYLVKATKYSYRPFDFRYTIFDNRILQRARYETMKNLLQPNIALQLTSKNRQLSLGYFFISKYISDRHLLDSAADSMSVFPLYLYPETNAQQSIEKSSERTVNFNMTIIDKIEKDLNLYFVEDDNLVVDLAAGWDGTIYPTDILDYIYAVLHSPTYREKYKEFLKIDFPRVPYPKEKSTFEKLTSLGSQLRQIHLLESPIVEKYITQYPIDGNNVVEKISFEVYDYIHEIPNEKRRI